MKEVEYEQFAAELDAAMQSHLEWSRRILRCAVLRASPGQDVMREDAHTLCRFGQWFSRNRFIFDALEAEKARALDINHRAMHDAIRQICNCILSNTACDEACLSTFETTQTLLIDCLAHFKTLSTQLGSQADPLTKLPLRHRLEQNFHIFTKRTFRQGTVPAVILVDADHFKTINDEHGHHAGDIVLRELASCLKNAVRESDQAYRYGGEEFLLLLELDSADHAGIAAQRVLEAVRKLAIALPEGAVIKPTVTLGAAIAQEGESLNRVIQHADLALYQGKEAGRDRYVVASPALQAG